MADPLRGLEDDLETQRTYLAGRVPAYEALLALLIEAVADRSVRERLAAAWARRSFGGFYERPLLLLASLRDDALAAGEEHPLWSAIGADEPDPESSSLEAAMAALRRPRFWDSVRDRHVQTNETSRAVAWLWPAALAGRAEPQRPIELFDIGASAGLNLVADLLEPIWEDESGTPLPVAPPPEVAARRGFDLRPLDVLDADGERWLRACVWPGQRDRLARLDEAIAAFRRLEAEGQAPVIEAMAAQDVPAALTRSEGTLALAYQTVVRDYLSAEEREAYERGMLDWLVGAPAGDAAWLQLELEAGAEDDLPFGLTARVATGGRATDPILLARSDPHPREMRVDDAAVRLFVAAIGGGADQAGR